MKNIAGEDMKGSHPHPDTACGLAALSVCHVPLQSMVALCLIEALLKNFWVVRRRVKWLHQPCCFGQMKCLRKPCCLGEK